jgi:hypothetical protein
MADDSWTMCAEHKHVNPKRSPIDDNTLPELLASWEFLPKDKAERVLKLTSTSRNKTAFAIEVCRITRGLAMPDTHKMECARDILKAAMPGELQWIENDFGDLMSVCLQLDPDFFGPQTFRCCRFW